MKKISTLLFVLSAMFLSLQTQAKVWRINNTPGVNANFSTVVAALANASVVNDDTLNVEGSNINYAGFTLNKRLVIIGTGYFLSGANSNTGLQANTNSVNFGGGYFLFDSTASGSVLMGLDNFYMALGPTGSATDNITITRCNLTGLTTYYGVIANTIMAGWKINKCYVSSTLGGTAFVIQNWEITNNIFTGSLDIPNANNVNNLVRNNVFRSPVSIYGGYFANNIINNTTFTVLNVTIKNNLAIGAPAGFTPYVGTNGNLNNQTDAAIFQGLTGNSTDGQWRLKAGTSPAIGAGLTIGAVISPDCGAFGATDPYKLSGIPNIPTIYGLTVPASIPAGTATMNITVSTKNNN